MKHTEETFGELFSVIKRLRAPDGCQWDLEQTPRSMRSALIEEAYECIGAIDNEDYDHVKEELGDLFLLVTMIAYMHEQEGQFSVADSLKGITEKLIRRHPHVFGDSKAENTEQIIKQWNEIKTEIEGRKAKDSLLDRVLRGLPPLEKSFELQKEAAKAGFDWKHVRNIWEKVQEEIEEVKEAEQQSINQLEAEIGDLLFAIVNLSRKYTIDPAIALQRTNNKFTKRFHFIEKEMKKNGKKLHSDNFSLMDALWDKAKMEES